MTDNSVQTNQSASGSKSGNRKQALFIGGARATVLCLVWSLGLVFAAQAQELSNNKLRLKLNVTPEGVPVIEEAVWQATGQTVFRDKGTPDGLSAWVPVALIPAATATSSVWTITEGDDLMTAEATCELTGRMLITWIVELPKQGQLFRLHVRLTNRGRRARAFDSFPAWLASWDLAGQSQWARWWRSLEYARVEQALNDGNRIRLGSRQTSSDDPDGGVNPYWVVGGSDSRIYFGLEWCGGWSAKLQSVDDGLKFSVALPSEETQLVLGRGESIEGPALLVTPMPEADEADDRANWMRQRHYLGRMLYSGPPLSVPLTYNHWYAAKLEVDDSFLNRQFGAMWSYAFDAFIVDAGWFAEKRWKPAAAKFQPGEFVDMMAALKMTGVKPGLWSTPQYVSTLNNESALAIVDPPVVSDFFSGSLVDLWQPDFPNYLMDHVRILRKKYSVDYWKYDQPFFTEHSQSGKMKDVVGLQNGLRAVRRANPDLVIENCLSGGRMINEFTLLTTQTSWLSDLGNSGIPNARGNISDALNALDFIFPWAALRFTINLDRIDPDNDELLRLNCRSAMAGMWGISTDLSRITDRQRAVLLQEIENYRRLNHLKFGCLYDLQLPGDSADVAGVTFYSRRRFHAGVLLYRWRREGAFDQHVVLPKLKSWATYRIVDADTGTEIIASGSNLINNGVTVPFSAQRLSALLFVEPLHDSQTPSEP